MISLTLRYDSGLFPTMHGRDAGEFLLSMLKENPAFALTAAEELEVKGEFGKFIERREP